MANYSVNQVRQFYVASTAVTGSTAVANVGDIKLQAIDDGNGVGTELYFLYKGNTGDVMKTDFIPVKNITSITANTAENLRVPLKSVEITLAANPIAGQDYVLGINFKNFFSSGDDSQYYKDAAVHATSGMTKKDLLDALKAALDKAFAREDGATSSSNPYLAFSVVAATGSGSSATPDKLVITEKPQEWELGTKKARRIAFDVFPGTIYNGTEDVIWAAQDSTTGLYYVDATPSKATVAAKASNDGTFIGNGQQIANLEWFCMGERGDQYRGMGYPNVLPKYPYMVVPTGEYDVLNIHFAFTDTGVNSYRTEKDLTIVADKSTSVVSTIEAAVKAYLPASNAGVAAAIADAG